MRKGKITKRPIVLDQGIDTSTPTGRLVFHVIGAVAEFERDLIRERTRAGMASARRKGSRIGRPRAHVSVGRARALLAQGWSQTAVARELGVPRSTLARALERVSPEDPASARPTAVQ